MKKLVNLLIGVCVTLLPLFSWSRDPGIPWPWASAVNIPLRDLRGVWRSTNSDDFFIFEYHSNNTGDGYLYITLYDPNSCEVLGTGMGDESDRAVYGQLALNQGGNYSFSVYAFNKNDVLSTMGSKEGSESELLNSGISDFVMAMSLFPVGSDYAHKSAVAIRRISTKTEMLCYKQK